MQCNLKKYNSMMLVLKNIISCAKRNESGSRNKVSCLKKGGEMNSFCLKQGQGLKAPPG